MSAYIKTLKNTDGDIIYPQTKTSAVYTNEGVNIESIFGNPALIDGSAPIIDTTMNVNADTLQGKNWSQMLTNRNLLDNWDFRNVVNQRGQTSYAVSGYTIDRWSLDFSAGNESLTMNDGYIRLQQSENGGTNSQSMYQFIEKFRVVPGVVHTVSMMCRGTGTTQIVVFVNGTVFLVQPFPATPDFTLKTCTFVMPDSITEDNVGIFLYADTSGNLGYTDFKAVKLELGSVSTLANNPPADFGAELAKCQRYFYKPTGDIDISGRTFTATQSFAQLYLPFAMRTTPAIVVTNLGSFYDSLGGHTVTGISVERFSGNAVRLTLTSSGMYAGQQPGILCDSLFSLSADL